MDKDFHFYATYVAARFNGYTDQESEIIAYAAQYTDDCVHDHIKKIKSFTFNSKSASSIQTCMANKEYIGKFSDNAYNKVWMPFHFLPGNFKAKNDADKAKRKTVQTIPAVPVGEGKQICIPESILVERIVNNAIQVISPKENKLHAIGLAMHVLADTYAHAFFSGTCNARINNVVQNVYDENSKKIKFGGFYEECTPWPPYNNSIFALGHGRMGHLPDYPFLNYNYVPSWDDGIWFFMNHRKNFLAAFGAVYYALYCAKRKKVFTAYHVSNKIPLDLGSEIRIILNTNTGLYESPEKSVNDRCELWVNGFKNIKFPKYDHEKWITEENKANSNFACFQAAAITHRALVKYYLDANDVPNWNLAENSVVDTDIIPIIQKEEAEAETLEMFNLIKNPYENIFDYIKYYERDPLAQENLTFTIKTSVIENAGTDSKIYIKIFGKMNNNTADGFPTYMASDWIKFDKKEHFENGKIDTIQVNAFCPDKIDYIEILTDMSGNKPGWHCEYVTITRSKTGLQYVFKANEWINNSQVVYRYWLGDQKTYVFNVKTADIEYAGTDSNIYFRLFSKIHNYYTGWKNASNAVGGNAFERGKTNDLTLNWSCPGDISHLEIKSDMINDQPGWFCSSICMNALNDSVKKTIFSIDTWVIEKNEIYKFSAGEPDEYQFAVATADKEYAGTGAKIHVRFLNEVDDYNTPWYEISERIATKIFSRNTTEKFKININRLNKLSAIQIKSDMGGDYPGWYCDKIKVENRNGEKYAFSIDTWIDKKKEVYTFYNQKSEKYKFEVKTSDIEHAGTNAKVYLRFISGIDKYRKTYITSWYEISTRIVGDPMERGKTETFEININMEMDIDVVQIKSDMSGDKPGWHCDHIFLKKENGSSLDFSVKSWINEKDKIYAFARSL